jgi:hypothetical protein
MPRELRPILAGVEAAAQAGLSKAGKETLTRAKELAPKRTGRLRRSGRAVEDDLSVTVKFTAPHAWLVHERTENAHPNGGQAKYLETAALEVDVGKAVADAVRAHFGG